MSEAKSTAPAVVGSLEGKTKISLMPFGHRILAQVVDLKPKGLIQEIGRRYHYAFAFQFPGGMPVPVVKILARGGRVKVEDFPIGRLALVHPLNLEMVRPMDVNNRTGICLPLDRDFVAILAEDYFGKESA